MTGAAALATAARQEPREGNELSGLASLHAKLDVILEGQVEMLDRVDEGLKLPDFGCLLDRPSVV
jgi:hypothetical protein